jgi:predicted MFS family arabinose efflux permease
VLAVAAAHALAEPLFFLYLKSPPRYHSDALVMAYVAFIWAASGYVNTGANMCAPRMVPPQLKSAAAGLMALCYQAGHVAALTLATALAALLFGFRNEGP